MRKEVVTTVLEISAGVAAVGGVYVLAGLGWALVTFAVVAVGFSWLVSSK